MFIDQLRNSFEFDDDFAEADEIGCGGLSKWTSFVGQGEIWVGDERDLLITEFYLKTLLEDGFQKATALFSINFKAGSHQLIGFRWVY